MYELHNPHNHRIEVTLPANGGIIVIPSESCVPTAAHEAEGITPATFKDYVPSFLKPTPPAVRRRLLESEGKQVPEDLRVSTAHLPEFGGAPGPAISAGPSQVAAGPGTTVMTAEEINAVTETERAVAKAAQEAEATPPSPASPPVAPPPPAPKKEEGKLPNDPARKRGTRGVGREEASQEMADALCSSTRAKRGKKMDNPT